MNRAIGISCAAIFATVCGGIGLSLANTSSNGRWDMPLFGAPATPVGYGEIAITAPKQYLQPAPVEETKFAVLSDEIEALPTVRDLPKPKGEAWSLPAQGLAPIIASRPKARVKDEVASIDPIALPDRVANDEPAPVLAQPARRASTVSRSRTQPLHRSAPRRSSTPQPDFLIGVYR